MCNSLNFNVTIHEHRVSTYLIAFLNMGQNREYPRSVWERVLDFITLIKIAAPLRNISQMVWKGLGLLASTSLGVRQATNPVGNEMRIVCACTTPRERTHLRINLFMLIFPKWQPSKCSNPMFSTSICEHISFYYHHLGKSTGFRIFNCAGKSCRENSLVSYFLEFAFHFKNECKMINRKICFLC